MYRRRFNFVYFLCFTMAVLTILSCRKGPEDPFISLLSRKSRLVGKWKLVEGRDTSTNGSTSRFVDYNSTSMIEYSLGAGIVNSYPYEETWTFNKNSTFSYYTKTQYPSGRIEEQTANGTWDFNSGYGDEKKKEKVILTVTEYIDAVTINSSTNAVSYKYSTNDEVMTLDLVRLSNNELKIYDLSSSSTLGWSDISISHKTFKSYK